MKALLKIRALVFILGIQGCVAVGSMSPSTCQPYPAGDLMKWAQEAGGGQNPAHQRSARVATYNGRVDCSSEEVASSKKGEPTRPAVQQFNYSPYGYSPY